jgi:hypothetical protein
MVLAGGFSDGSQTNIASGTATTLYDTDPPTVSSIVAPNVLASQTSASITTVTINYADSLAGIDPSSFNTGNITVANGANVIGINAVGNSVSYTILSPAANWGLSTQGSYGISLGSSPVRDLAGNSMTTLTGSFTVDTIAPGATLTLAPAPSSASNASSFTATVVFSQPVGATLALPPSVTNGSIGLVTPAQNHPSNTTFSFTVTPINTGAVSIQIPGGAALDAAGNPSTASNSISFTSDRVQPIGTLATSPSTVNIANAGTPVTFSVNYSDIGSGINPSTLSSLATTVSVPGGGTLTPTVSGTNNNTVTYNLNLGSNPAQGPLHGQPGQSRNRGGQRRQPCGLRESGHFPGGYCRARGDRIVRHG